MAHDEPDNESRDNRYVCLQLNVIQRYRLLKCAINPYILKYTSQNIYSLSRNLFICQMMLQAA